MAATPRLYCKKFIVNGCKTVPVAGNGVTMRVFSLGKSCTSLAVDYHFGRTPRKKWPGRLAFAWLTPKSQERPRPVFGSQMKQTTVLIWWFYGAKYSVLVISLNLVISLLMYCLCPAYSAVITGLEKWNGAKSFHLRLYPNKTVLQHPSFCNVFQQLFINR